MKKSNNKIFAILIILLIVIIFVVAITNTDKKQEGTLKSISYEEITKKIDNEDSFILIVSQSTCSHCATYKPKVQTIAKEYSINIYYIDYDKESEKNQNDFLKEFNLDGATPITIFIKDGKPSSVLDRIEGDVSKQKAIEKFKKMGFIEE